MKIARWSLLLLAAIAPLAGQNDADCTLQTTPSTPLRAGGRRELTAPLSLVCQTSSGIGSGLVLNLTLESSVPITSRAAAASGFLETIVRIDPLPNPNAKELYQAERVKDTVIQVQNIRFDMARNSTRTYRFDNLRLDVSALAPGDRPTVKISALAVPFGIEVSSARQDGIVAKAVSVSNASATVGVVTTPVATSVADARLLKGESGTNVRVATLRFRETFASALRRRSADLPKDLDTRPTPTAQADVVAGVETGVYFPDLTPNGLADHGTRLQAIFTNIPSGVTLFVTQTNDGANLESAARLIVSDANGTGDFKTITGDKGLVPLSVTNGTATATWEVLNDSASLVNEMNFGVVASYPSGYESLPIRVRLLLAPVSATLAPAFVAGDNSAFLGPVFLSAVAGSRQVRPLGQSFITPLTVFVVDGAKKSVANVPVTFSAPAGGATAQLPGVRTVNTNADGLAQINAAAGTVSGSYTVSATTTGAAAAALFELGNQGVPVTVQAFGGTPQSASLGTSFAAPLQARVLDAANNPVPGITVTFIAPASSGATCAFIGNVTVAVTNADGVATSALCTANNLPGTYPVQATAPGAASATFSLTNVGYTLSLLAGNNQSARAGTAFANALQARLLDAGQNPVPGVTVTFAVPGSGASAVFANGVNTAVTNANGVATANALTANQTAGAFTVTASAPGAANTLAYSLTNTLATLSATAGTPQATRVGTPFPTALQVRLLDANQNPVAGVTVTFAAPGSGASGTFANNINTAVTSANGIATAPAFTANSIAGAYTVTATAPGASGSATFALTNTLAVISATGGTPQSARVGGAFPTALQARVLDANQLPVPGVTVTFTAPVSGASGTFANGMNTAVTDASGFATAPAFTANNTTGAYTVSATAPGATGTASFSLTNALAVISATAGTPQSARVGTAFSTALQVRVLDPNQLPVPGVTVTFTAPATGSSGTFANGVNTAVTDASGFATASVFTANSIAGAYTVSATAPGASGAASFALTNTTVALSSVAGTPQATPAGRPFATAFQVRVLDANQNPVSGVTVTFTAPASGPSGTFANGVNTAVTNASGIATAPAFTANTTTGAYNVVASAPGTSSTASFALTNLELVLTPLSGTPQSAPIGTAFAAPLRVRVADATGAVVRGVTVTFFAPNSGATGAFANGVNTAVSNADGIATSAVFTANQTLGRYAVDAFAPGSGNSAATFDLTNVAGAPAALVSSAGTPQSARLGGVFATRFAVRVTDAQQNPLSGITVTFAAPAAGASGAFANNANTAVTNNDGIATAAAFTANNLAGTYSVVASVSGVTGNAAFALTNRALTLQLLSGSGQSAAIGAAYAAPLRVRAADGDSFISGIDVTFTAPSTGARGTFNGAATAIVTTDQSGIAQAPVLTAGTVAGAFNVTANAAPASAPVTFSFTNNAGPPASITATAGTPQSAQVGSVFSTALQARVTDAGQNPLSGVTVTFTAPSTGARGVFANGVNTAVTNAEGLATAPAFTANNIPGAYSVVASVSGLSSTATFALTNSAASTVTCNASATAVPVRAGGQAELAASVLITCTGGSPLFQTLEPITWRVAANVPITSRILGQTTGEAPRVWRDALLLIDEPAPGQQFPCLTGFCLGYGNGQGTGYYGAGELNRNVFQGSHAPSASDRTLEFASIPFDPPGANAVRRYRLENIRVDASQANGPVTLDLSLQNFETPIQFTPVTLTVATPVAAGAVSVFDPPGLALQPTGNLIDSTAALNAQRAATLRYSETFAALFKRRTSATPATADVSPAPANQNTPGVNANTETGFFNSAFPSAGNYGDLSKAGLADHATRLVLRFTNVPDGAQLLVRTTNEDDSGVTIARLIQTDVSGQGVFQPQPGSPTAPISLLGGSGIAVYELVQTNPALLETLTLPVFVTAPAGTVTTAPVRVEALLAPSSTPLLAIPRFSLTASNPQPLFELRRAAPVLLTAAPGALAFTVRDGQITAPQQLTIATSNPLVNVDVSLDVPGALPLVLAIPTGKTTLVTNVQPANGPLQPGRYDGTIRIVSPQAANSPLLVPVSLTVERPLRLLSLDPVTTVAQGPAFRLNAQAQGVPVGSVLLWDNEALPTVVFNDNLAADVPARLIANPGRATIRIRTPENVLSNSLPFDVTPRIILSSLDPVSVTATRSAFTLTVTGSGFLPGSQVKLGDLTLTPNTTSSSLLLVNVPASAVATPRDLPVQVIAAGGSSNALNLGVLPKPEITGVTGDATAPMRVNGNFFRAAHRIIVNGLNVATQFVSDRQLIAILPGGLDLSTLRFIVTTPDGVSSNEIVVTQQSATQNITISGLLAAGDTNAFLTLDGVGFQADTVVDFSRDGRPPVRSTPTRLTITQMVIPVPAALLDRAGPLQIQLIPPRGTAIPNPMSTNVLPAPELFSVSPATVTVGGPAPRLLAVGANILAGSRLVVNGQPVATDAAGSGLGATLPASAFTLPGAIPIRVQGPGGALSNEFNLTAVLPALPAITLFLDGPAALRSRATIAGRVRLAAAFPVDLDIDLALDFEPEGGGPFDPSVALSRRRVTIPAGSGESDLFLLNTGATAGIIVLSSTVTPARSGALPGVTQRVTVLRQAPEITGLRCDRNFDARTLVITADGFTNTREMRQARFTFEPAAGETLAATEFTLDVANTFGAFFARRDNPPPGGLFSYRQEFTVQGSPGSIGSVSLTVVNGAGASNTLGAECKP